MSKHTPGPWKLVYEWMDGDDELQLVIVTAESAGVAFVYSCARNARLIAAAPEMLDTLRAILDEVDSDLAYLISDPLRRSARALLARIDGDDDA